MAVTPIGEPLEFRILGEMAIRAGGRSLPLGAPKQRTLTAMLLVNPNAVVPLREMIEELWGEAPPKSATANIRTYAARLRAALPAAERDRLVVRPLGYQLRIGDDELDLTIFQTHAAYGRSALQRADFADALSHLDNALRMWRGRLAEDVRAGTVLTAREVAFDQQRLSAEEDLCEALLNTGRHAPAVGVLRAMVAAQPLRERAWALLMRALYAAHDTGGALTAFAEARSALVESLGIEPGDELQDLYRAMLRRDARLVRAVPPGPAQLVKVTAPRQLPPKPPLVGRDGELRRLAALLGPAGDSAVVNVYGPPGAGKSGLALFAAHLMLDHYPDGQLYADLRGSYLDPGVVLDRFLDALGVPAGQRPDDQDSAVGRYRSLLAGRRMLVMLDNVADVTQVRPFLVSAPHAAVLVTSGQMMSTVDDARHLRLLELTEAGSVAMLAQLVGDARVRPESVTAARLAQLCGHLPIALRIAAARLVEHPEWSIRDLVRRLSDPGSRLDELEAGDLSLRVCLRAPFNRLTGGGRPSDHLAARSFRLLGSRRLTVIDPAQVATLTGVTGSRAAQSLDRLVEVHLLTESQPGGYRLPELPGLLAAELAGSPRPPQHDAEQAVRVEEPTGPRVQTAFGVVTEYDQLARRHR